MKVERITYELSPESVEVPGGAALLKIGAELSDGTVLEPGSDAVSGMLPKTTIGPGSQIDAMIIGGSHAWVSVSPRYDDRTFRVGETRQLVLKLDLGPWSKRIEIPVTKTADFVQQPSVRISCSDGVHKVTRREEDRLRKAGKLRVSFFGGRYYSGTVAQLLNFLAGGDSPEATVRESLVKREAWLVSQLEAVRTQLAQ